MKLNKTELIAIADKIYSDIRDNGITAQKEQDALSDEMNKKECELLFKRMNALPPILFKILNCDRLNKKELLKAMRTAQTKVRMPTYEDRQNIYNALVIAQIESADMTSMIEKIKEQFSKI